MEYAGKNVHCKKRKEIKLLIYIYIYIEYLIKIPDNRI